MLLASSISIPGLYFSRFSSYNFSRSILIIMCVICASDNKYKWKIKGSYDDCSCQIFLLKDNGIEWAKVSAGVDCVRRNISSIDCCTTERLS